MDMPQRPGGTPAQDGLFAAGDLSMPAPSLAAAGPALRDARERSGLSIADVARETRISARHLTALEEGRLDGFAAPVYALGFARNYARAVGVPREWIDECLRNTIAREFDARGRFDLGWTREGLRATRYR